MRNNSKIILLLIFATITVIGGCSQQQYEPEQITERHPLLLVSFDGFHPDYLEKVDTPNFDSLAAGGVQSEGIIPVYPTNTFPNHYAIVTGLYPENSGFINNTMYDPKWDEWYRIGDRESVEDGKWYGGEPIWNTLEKQGLTTGTMFWVGSEADIQGMRPTYWNTYDSSVQESARIDTVVKWFSAPEEQAVDFATLYFEDVDTWGHNYGPNSEEVEAAIQYADEQLGYLKERLQDEGLWETMNIIVLSDHGMIDLSEDKTIELDRYININEMEHIIWGAFTMIQPKEGQTEEVYESLKSSEENFRVYRKKDLPERYRLKDHRRVSDIVMIADPGYAIMEWEDREYFKESLPRGSHGYDNNEEAMQALFIAHGPNFREGAEVGTFQNIHIYELMNHLMGTTPAENDGSLDSLGVLLD